MRIYKIRHKKTGMNYKADVTYKGRKSWEENYLHEIGSSWIIKPNIGVALGKHVFAGNTKLDDWEVVLFELVEKKE